MYHSFYKVYDILTRWDDEEIFLMQNLSESYQKYFVNLILPKYFINCYWL
jgi:hypothetical protein